MLGIQDPTVDNANFVLFNNYQGMKFVVSCGGAVVLEMGLAGKARTPFVVLLVTDPFTAVVVAAVVTTAGVETSELVL